MTRGDEETEASFPEEGEKTPHPWDELTEQQRFAEFLREMRCPPHPVSHEDAETLRAVRRYMAQFRGHRTPGFLDDLQSRMEDLLLFLSREGFAVRQVRDPAAEAYRDLARGHRG